MTLHVFTRRLPAAVVVLGGIVGGLLGLPMLSADASSAAFPDCPRTTLTRTGEQANGIDQPNPGGTWDLEGATFSATSLFPYPIRSDSWSGGCIIGGSVLGPIDPSATREQWYNAGTHGGADHEGVRITHDGSSTALIRDVYVENVEDGFDPNASISSAETYLDHVHASYIRDDCIENEKDIPHSVFVRNSLFDGCFAAFAEKPSGSSVDAGSGDAEFVVEDSLVYVQPQPLGDGYCSDRAVSRGRCVREGDHYLGAYGMFKWGADAASRVVVRNTIIRMDLPSYSSCSGNRFPTNGVYENVTLVWTGPGDWRSAGGCTNEVPPGVSVTTDVSVWDQAKAAWLADAPKTPEASPSPTEQSSPSPQPIEQATPSPSPSSEIRLVCPVVLSPRVGDTVTCTYQ